MLGDSVKLGRKIFLLLNQNKTTSIHYGDVWLPQSVIVSKICFNFVPVLLFFLVFFQMWISQFKVQLFICPHRQRCGGLNI